MANLSDITDLSMLEGMDKEQLIIIIKEMIEGNAKQLKDLEIVKDEILADTEKCNEILAKLGVQ
jgi:hypothetical protein